jgi:tetratricopeptide (TPR) repeat protein
MCNEASEDNPIWTVKMILCGEDDKQLNEVYRSLKSDLPDKTDLYSVGKVLYDMDRGDNAKHAYEVLHEHSRIEYNGELFNPIEPYTPGQYYPEMIKEAQELVVKIIENDGNRNELSYYYLTLVGIYKDLEQYESALENYSKSLDVLVDLYGQNHLNVCNEAPTNW